jgi:hypothetical protein
VRLDPRGSGYCIEATSPVPVADEMLANKLLLETDGIPVGGPGAMRVRVGWCWSSWPRSRRGEAAKRGVGSVGVVLDPPGLDHHLGDGQAGELLEVAEFVADPSVE